MSDSISPRAARLLEEARAAREALQNTEVKREKPKRAAKSGAASRDLNRRIRGVLKEQVETVYGAPETVPENVREYSRDENGAAENRVFHSQEATHETEAHEKSRAENVDDAFFSGAEKSGISRADSCDESENAPREKVAAGSWESLADEIAPVGARPARGLATGTARRIKPAKTDASTREAPLIWRNEPLSPRAILSEVHAPETALHDALRGTEKRDSTGEAHYLLSRDAAHYDAAFSHLGARLSRVLAGEKFAQLEGAAPHDLLFVDIETTGLSSSLPLFLIGALAFSEATHQGKLHLFLARDYPEERPLLDAFHELAAGKSLVTFNGKSFDWPYIEGRSTAHRLRFQKPPAHFDLLHFARRQWKNQLPNCKLQTLELYLCGRNRIDDVAGGDIPRTYHEFVQTHAKSGGGAHLMGPILHHNALDILTMAELFCLAGEEL